MSAITPEQLGESVPTRLETNPQLRRRKLRGNIYRGLLFGATAMSVVVLGVLLWSIWSQGSTYLSWNLITENATNSRNRIANAGFYNGLIGTLWILLIAGSVAIPVGIGAAIYLEEYAPDTLLTRILQTNISNLAGVPSAVYGLLGLGVFVNFFGYGTFMDRILLAGGLTMALLIMPIIIIASQEAIRAVPLSLRQAAFALGATPWQVARSHVLPSALPGMLTGTILGIARAAGETAPLLIAGAALYITFVPSGPGDRYTVLPMQIFNYATRPQQEFKDFAAAGIILLMSVVLLVNLTAIIIRERASRRARW